MSTADECLYHHANVGVALVMDKARHELQRLAELLRECVALLQLLNTGDNANEDGKSISRIEYIAREIGKLAEKFDAY